MAHFARLQVHRFNQLSCRPSHQSTRDAVKRIGFSLSRAMEHSHVASDTPQSYGAIPENEVYVEDVHLIEGGLHDRADDDSDHHNLFTGGGRSRSNSLAESAASSVRDVLLSGFHYEGSVCSIREFGGDASIPNEIINMVKNLIGAGVLSLSGGMADFSNSPLGACITASVWIVLLGIIFGYVSHKQGVSLDFDFFLY